MSEKQIPNHHTAFDAEVQKLIDRMTSLSGYTEHAARYHLATRILPELAVRLFPTS
jgi:hypothetical protein